METWVAVLIVVAVIIVAIAIAAAVRQSRSARLRNRFGDEYDRRVEERGDRKAVEIELRDATKRRKHLEVHALTEPARIRYKQRWDTIQSQFVDQPDTAVTEADALVGSVMRERGYPVDDFDQRFEMVIIDHPKLAENYRAAHGIYERNSNRMASTDDLRQALLHYRGLFEELLSPEGNHEPTARKRPQEATK